MLKVGMSVLVALGILNLAVLAAHNAHRLQATAYAAESRPEDLQRIAELERKLRDQREWIRQREEATTGSYVYYSPDTLHEIETGHRDPQNGLVRSVQRGLGGTPYAGFGP